MKLRLTERTVDLDTGELEPGDSRLTKRERDLLLYLLAAEGSPVSRDVLLEEVWGLDPAAASRAVDKYVATLRAKIEADSRKPSHVVTVHGEGYQLVGATLVVGEAATAPPPHYGDAFIGRTEALDTLTEVARADSFLWTIVGPGGIGKTRLLVEFAARSDERVVWVSLAGARSESDIRIAWAEALGSAPSGLEAAARSQRTIFVLDECEGCSTALCAVLEPLRATGGLRALCTSRGALGLEGQERLVLGGLDSQSAHALLLDRSGGRECQDTRDISDLLEGIPLAIELAARRLRIVPPPRLAAALRQPLRVLRGGPRDRPRHVSMEAAIGASWDALTPKARALAIDLSVFCAPMGMDAVMQVTGANPDTVDAVVGAALWQVQDGLGSMLRVVREFVQQQGNPSTETTQRHARWFADRADKLVPRLLIGPKLPTTYLADHLAAAACELDDETTALNLLAAARIHPDHGTAAELVTAATQRDVPLPIMERALILSIGVRHGLHQDTTEDRERLAALPVKADVRAVADIHTGFALRRAGDLEGAAEAFARASGRAENAPLRTPDCDGHTLAWRVTALVERARCLSSLQQPEQARETLATAERVAAGTTDAAALVRLWRVVAHIEAVDGNLRTALRYNRRCIDLLDEHEANMGLMLAERGGLLIASGRFQEAAQQEDEAARIAQALGVPPLERLARVLQVLALLESGDPASASALGSPLLDQPSTLGEHEFQLRADLAAAAAALAEPEVADDLLAEAAGRKSGRAAEAYLAVRRAEVLNLRGDAGGAQEALAQASSIWHTVQAPELRPVLQRVSRQQARVRMRTHSR